MNNFYVRKQTFNEEVIKETDYNGLIKSVINSFPNLTLNPNSNLAALATQQYNEKIINSNSTDRPSIPNWFCGYRDTESGLLYLSDFESDSLEKININTNYNLSIQLLSSYNVRYTSDRCLEIGQSGSYDYSFCLSGASLTLEELIGIDWSQSFYPTDLIDTAISQLESAVRSEVETAILAAQASSLTEGGFEGGVPCDAVVGNTGSSGNKGTLLNWYASKDGGKIIPQYTSGWLDYVEGNCVKNYSKAKQRVSELPSDAPTRASGRTKVLSGFIKPLGSATGNPSCVPNHVEWTVSCNNGVTFIFTIFNDKDHWGGRGAGNGVAKYRGTEYIFDVNNALRKGK